MSKTTSEDTYGDHMTEAGFGFVVLIATLFGAFCCVEDRLSPPSVMLAYRCNVFRMDLLGL